MAVFSSLIWPPKNVHFWEIPDKNTQLKYWLSKNILSVAIKITKNETYC